MSYIVNKDNMDYINEYLDDLENEDGFFSNSPDDQSMEHEIDYNNYDVEFFPDDDYE